MRIAILGGTGDLGRGLAARFSEAGHDVVLGSRDAGRAGAIAAGLQRPNVSGAENSEAARAADVVILTVPFNGHAEFVAAVSGSLEGKIVVDTTVSMGPKRAFMPPAAGSAAAEAQALLSGARVVAAFHTLSASLLADTARPLDQDALICGQDPAAKAMVIDLSATIGARGVDAGGLDAAATLEALAVLLINLDARYRRRDLGIRIAHLPADARPR
ncbi:MAG TPA: NADPH-dependent F420 reductase [bacterium]|nr:NADPH-dependent F420 reductase [bacterium]